MSQFREPNFGDATTSTSTALEVKADKEVTDPYPTHANYSKVLQNQEVIFDNNIVAHLI